MHDDVDLAEHVDGGTGEPVALRLVRDVGRHRDRPRAERLDEFRHFLQIALGPCAEQATSAPSRANTSAISFPNPGPTPETIAALPSSSTAPPQAVSASTASMWPSRRATTSAQRRSSRRK